MLSTLCAALALGACGPLGYYSQLATGEYQVLARREPIAKLVAAPGTDAQLRQRLQLAQAARMFASEHLALPRNGSYTLYSDLRRPYAVWNVFAAPELSLQALTHCFPIAGCVAYRGYYSEAAADAEAGRLRVQGYETYVGGVAAYSTLGWFDDPILSTMLRWDDDELATTIFHELAHQKLYVKGDTEFNESFASFVGEEGLRQWRAARGLPATDSDAMQREDQFTRLVLDARTRLQTLYASGLPPEALRSGKQAEIARLRQDYRQLRDTQWQGYSGYDHWMNGEINNAKLLPFGLYHQWLPAFAALYAQQPDWPAFFAAAKALADEKPGDRRAALLALQAAPGGPAVATPR